MPMDEFCGCCRMIAIKTIIVTFMGKINESDQYKYLLICNLSGTRLSMCFHVIKRPTDSFLA